MQQIGAVRGVAIEHQEGDAGGGGEEEERREVHVEERQREQAQLDLQAAGGRRARRTARASAQSSIGIAAR